MVDRAPGTYGLRTSPAQWPIEQPENTGTSSANEHSVPEYAKQSSNSIIARPLLINGLPVEIQQEIMLKVLDDPNVRRGVQGIFSLTLASRRLKTIFESGTLLRDNYEVRAKIIKSVNRMSTDLLRSYYGTPLFALASRKQQKTCIDGTLGNSLSHSPERVDEELAQLGKGMSALDPKQQKKLIHAAYGDSSASHIRTCNIMGQWGHELKVLTKEQRSGLVALIRKANPEIASLAISGLEKALHTFEAELCHELAKATLNMEDEQHRSAAIQSLAVCLPQLSNQQIIDMIESALRMADSGCRANAIFGLGAHLALFTDAQGRQLVEAALAMSDQEEGENKTHAIRGIAQSLPTLDSERHEGILNALVAPAVALIDDHNRLTAIRSIANGLRASTSEQILKCHEQLLDAALQLDDESNFVRAIGSFGPVLSALRPAQCKLLFDAALDLGREQRLSIVLCRLAPGLPALDSGLKETWVKKVLALTTDMRKATALAGLGKGVVTLTLEQQAALVEMMLMMDDDMDKSVAIKGVCFLEDPQLHSRVLDTAFSLGTPLAQAQAMASLVEVFI